MAKFGGLALKLFQTILYLILFLCAAIILGIYSYFLSVLADRDLPIAAWKKAVEGISGAAVLYLIFAVLLTFFLGGKSFFAFLAIALDVAFAGAFIAIAVLTRDGADSCKGNVNTPLGSGPEDSGDSGYGANGFGFGEGKNATYSPDLGFACRLNKVAFAVSIIAVLLFLLSALVQLWLGRHHRKEKRFGPSPANGYTAGRSSRKFWVRKPKTGHAHHTRDAEMGTAPTGTAVTGGGLATEPHHDMRPSHDTGYTGSTMAPPNAHYNKYETPAAAHTTTPASTAYYSAPTGTAVSNPYGYDNTRGTATNY